MRALHIPFRLRWDRKFESGSLQQRVRSEPGRRLDRFRRLGDVDRVGEPVGAGDLGLARLKAAFSERAPDLVFINDRSRSSGRNQMYAIKRRDPASLPIYARSSIERTIL